MWPFSKKPIDPLVAQYRSGRSQSRPARRTPVDQLRFIVLDAETTGLVVGQDRILSVATAELRQGRMYLSTMGSWLVYQSRAEANDAATIHGITPADTAGGEPERKVLEELLPVLTGAVIVGHHIGFDAMMLDTAMRRHFGTGLSNSLVDTALLAMGEFEAFRRTGYANQRPPALDELCAHCGIHMMERHTAEGDVFTTSELFLLMLARRRKRLGRALEWRDLPSSKL